MITMVYEKSALGFKEFTTDKRTLGVRERQVLLLVNGVRKLDDLEKFFKRDHLMDTIKKLESDGYIQRQDGEVSPAAESAPVHSLPFFEADDSAQPICPTKLAAVKTILLEAADDYLGIMGRGIKSKIEACDTDNSLKQCISSWHMAMRESKLGRESASFLMEQIHQTLEGKLLDNNMLPQH
ncbi:MAG TPA: hypothetical protein PK571_00670 [Methylotenera sp.]|jgi:hypothetical protein|nr:hypothetical protein [Methylotenera sp.]